MPATVTTQVEWAIAFDNTDEIVSVKYTPETAQDFACVEISGADLRVTEIDGLIEQLARIRDEIKRIMANETTPAS